MTESIPTHEFTVSEDHEGLRLDQYLVQVCTDISRSKVHADLAAGLIQVDGNSRP